MKNLRAEDCIEWAKKTYGDGLVMTSSFGADSALMLHMVTQIFPKIPVILIDTGYLFPETYQFSIKLVRYFKLNLKVYGSSYKPEQFEKYFGRCWEDGEEGVKKYNSIIKTQPMDVALRDLGATAVISGVRAEQTENRSKMESVQLGDDGIFRIHPILSWTDEMVENYFIKVGLPRHPLVARGYGSIGDTHSTIPGKGREGRLLRVKNECGLHLTPEYDI
jgi:phosphoadenosine phosphosulfate reductase